MPSMLRALTVRCSCLCLLPVRAEPPPPAPSEPVVDTLHGVRVEDPFRNLENLRGPATRAWLETQGGLASASGADRRPRGARSASPSWRPRAAIRCAAMRRFAGGRVYYLKRRAGESAFKLMLRDGDAGDAAERVLVDPERFAAGGVPHAINWYQPSWDGHARGRHLGGGLRRCFDAPDRRRQRPRCCASRFRACARKAPASRPTTAASPSTRTASCRPARRRAKPTSTTRAAARPDPAHGGAMRSSAGCCNRRSSSSASTSAGVIFSPTAAGWWRAHHRHHGAGGQAVSRARWRI